MTVTLTPRVDMMPVPRVEIVVESTDVPAGTDRLTLWRSSGGRDRKVRGGIDRTMSTSVALIDYEPARGELSTYEAECWDGLTSLGRVAIGTLTVPLVGSENSVVVQQPLDPSLAVDVMNLSGSWPTLTRDAPGELIDTEDTVLPTFVGAGPRSGLKGVAIDFAVPSRAAAEKLQASLGTEAVRQLPIWLIRSGDGFLPRVFFCRVKSLTEIDIDVRFGGEWRAFRASVDECQPPAPALVIASLSYDDLDAAYDDYDERDAAYLSYDAMDRDYSLAGLAG